MKRFVLFFVFTMLVIASVLSFNGLAIGYNNVALHKTYTASSAYTNRPEGSLNDYQLVDFKELTDGVKGTTAYGTEWHAFWTDSVHTVVVDLEKNHKNLKKFVIEFQEITGSSIHLPAWCKFYSSMNGEDYTLLGDGSKNSKAGALYDYVLELGEEAEGRYIKAEFPKGAGMFVFASEFEIFVLGEAITEETPEPVEVIQPIKVLFNTGCVMTDEYIYGVGTETSVEEFFEIFDDKTGIALKNKQGEEKSTGIIATGDYVAKALNDDNFDIKTVIIEGDVNCDGKITGSDYLYVKRAFMGSLILDDHQMLAACVTNGTSIVSADYLKIKRHFLETYDLHVMYGRYEIEEYPMNFKSTSGSEYKMSCTYKGNPLTLTFDKKAWGTWNIGTFSYNNTALAGGGTDWEYVYRAGKSSGYTPFCGGNHENETLIDIKFYDGATGKEIVLKSGQSVDINSLVIVEETKINHHQSAETWCDVVRTYFVSGNRIYLEVDYEITADTYFGLSYTAMFPVSKKYGRYCNFFDQEGNDLGTVTTQSFNAAGFKDKFYYDYAATKCVIWGDENPSYKFEVEVYTPVDSSDSFANYEKTFYWDMNASQNKLYFSKFATSGAFVKAGHKMTTKTGWTFINEIDD